MTVEEYFASNIRGHTELMQGIAYDVSPQNEPHAFAVQQLVKVLLPRLLRMEKILRSQSPIVIPNWKARNAPEVDVAVIADKSYSRTPTSADAFGFIEVSDSMYSDDRETKIPLYVKSGIPAWIVNIQKRQVESYRSSSDLQVEHGQISCEDETFDVLGITIPVANVFSFRSDAGQRS